MDSKQTLIVFSHLRWNWVWQRLQHLLSRITSTFNILFIEEPILCNENQASHWTQFGQFVNRVKAHTARGVFSLPINLLTINQFFGKKLTPTQAKEFMENMSDRTIHEPQNFEEQAMKFIERELYENFFYGYTKKNGV